MNITNLVLDQKLGVGCEYVRDGQIDPTQLLRLEEIYGHVFAKQGAILGIGFLMTFLLFCLFLIFRVMIRG